jgi:hypothetical protein
LGTSVDTIGFPSVGRVVLGFLFTVGLAVGFAFVLRRGWGWPLLLRRKTLNSRMRVVDRAAVSRTLTVHLVEVDGARVIIAEGRGGVGVSVLPPGMSTVVRSDSGPSGSSE